MQTHPLDHQARLALWPRASQRLLVSAQILRVHEHHELRVSPRDYRDAAASVRAELAERSTAWLLRMRLRLPPVVQGMVEDELDIRRAQPPRWPSLAAPLLQIPFYDEAWQRQAAAPVWHELKARMRQVRL